LAELHQFALELAKKPTALARLDRLSDGERQIVRDVATRLVSRVLYPVSRSLGEGRLAETGKHFLVQDQQATLPALWQ
jgi:hypothetical protein